MCVHSQMYISILGLHITHLEAVILTQSKGTTTPKMMHTCIELIRIDSTVSFLGIDS